MNTCVHLKMCVYTCVWKVCVSPMCKIQQPGQQAYTSKFDPKFVIVHPKCTLIETENAKLLSSNIPLGFMFERMSCQTRDQCHKQLTDPQIREHCEPNLWFLCRIIIWSEAMHQVRGINLVKAPAESSHLNPIESVWWVLLV